MIRDPNEDTLGTGSSTLITHDKLKVGPDAGINENGKDN